MMKIVIDDAIPFLKGRFPDNVEVVSIPGSSISVDDVKEADALIIRTRTKCDKNLLAGSQVKLIATATIGTDHIDIPWCEKNGISIINSAGCNAPGVAQYLFASLFKTGFDPEKNILGIIGYGNVGHIVAEWASQLGIKTLISDPPRKESGLKDIGYVKIEEVLSNTDAVTLHVPLTKKGKYPTYKMIGKKELQIMKPGAILVNSSRGGVVDESSLKSFLIDKRLKAIIDVWENEPFIDEELAHLAEIATPHIAGYSEEGKKRATRMALENLNNVLEIPTDLKGLECEIPENIRITKNLIENSYDPVIDSSLLRENISSFENLRNNYSYRHEPLFSHKVI